MLDQRAEGVGLHLQVEAIQQSVTRLTSNAIHFEREAPELHYQPLIENEFAGNGKTQLHQYVENRALQIRSILSSKPSTSSIQEAGCAMINLSIALSNLGMPEQAANVGLGTPAYPF